LIRIAIFADTLARAQSLAKLLGEDERLEIVDARAWFPSRYPEPPPIVDVIVAAGPRIEQTLRDGPPVILLSSQPPAAGAFARSIRAWLTENAAPAEIAAAIVAATQEFTLLTQAQARQWLSNVDRVFEERPVPLEALTAREVQVLRMMADGLGNKQIAAQLEISDHTAKFHVAQILAKLGAASRAEAVAIGMRRGLVPI
jgi:DNA-binding NarL/FixJ family response regulator